MNIQTRRTPSGKYRTAINQGNCTSVAYHHNKQTAFKNALKGAFAFLQTNDGLAAR